MKKKYIVLMCLLSSVATLSGCNGCSGKLSPEAERAMNSGRYSMDEGTTQTIADDGGNAENEASELAVSHDGDAPETSETSEGSGSSTFSEVSSESRDGNNLEVPARLKNLPEQIIRKKAYVTSFNNQTLMPNWVAWQLTREETYGHLSRNGMKFQDEYDVDPKYLVTTFDYMQSGYDRGHMCPAGDNKWDRKALQECFRMTNMCPQLHSLNAGDWNDLEMKCRDWAREYGEIYIVCGPIVSKNSPKKIGKQHKITVPTGFFKVVLCMKGTPKAIGFIFDNVNGSRSMASYVRSVDDVERAVGMDFFPALPDNIENKVEAESDYGAW